MDLRNTALKAYHIHKQNHHVLGAWKERTNDQCITAISESEAKLRNFSAIYARLPSLPK